MDYCYLLRKYSGRITGIGNCTVLITGISFGMHFFMYIPIVIIESLCFHAVVILRK